MHEKVKILLVSRSKAHFTYYESLVHAFLNRGHHLQILFDDTWSKGVSDIALQRFLTKHPTLSVGTMAYRQGFSRAPLFLMRELRSYSSYLRRPEQSVYYAERWRKYLPKSLQTLTQWPGLQFLLKQSWMSTLFRMIESSVSPASSVIKHLSREQPDAVLVTPANMRYSEEIEYIKAARQLSIPVFVPILSWDNLTTKGLFHVLPDYFLAWNSAHCHEAITLHGAHADQVKLTGSPFFDKWFDQQAESSRLERTFFCQQLGLDPERPYIVYLGSSKNIARDETWLVEALHQALQAQDDDSLCGMQLLVRPHPANVKHYEKISDLPNVVVWPKQGALPESDSARDVLYNSLVYCVATVGVNTSAMIDAIILDRPVISIISPQYTKTQSSAMHFQHLVQADVLEMADSIPAILEILQKLEGGIDSKQAQRRQFVRNFIRPNGLDRSAGEMGVEAVEALTRGTHWPLETVSPKTEPFLTPAQAMV
jgi:hypothetical protein